MSKPRILFIDDEEIVLRSCRRIFASSDYEIDTAQSGEEGLSKAINGDYDIVVTDLKMPGSAGQVEKGQAGYHGDHFYRLCQR